MKRGWEHFPHEADMGVRGWGSSLEEAFEETALALVALTTELDAVNEVEAIEVRCKAPDMEVLLVDWLNAIVLEMATGNRVFRRFEVSIDETRLKARAWGERRDPDRHPAGVEVKGATFTELDVSRDSEGRWLAQCIVDV